MWTILAVSRITQIVVLYLLHLCMLMHAANHLFSMRRTLNVEILLSWRRDANVLQLESSTSAHLQEAVCLQLAQDGCLLPGMLQGKRAHMVSSVQWARPPVQQGLALCRYDLMLCPSTAAYLQVEACLSTAAHMTVLSCNARGSKFRVASSLAES